MRSVDGRMGWVAGVAAAVIGAGCTGMLLADDPDGATGPRDVGPRVERDASSLDDDAGPERDAGPSTTMDGGTTASEDGGTTASDDGGSTTIDAGPTTIDAGPIAPDAGPAPIDAGPLDDRPSSARHVQRRLGTTASGQGYWEYLPPTYGRGGPSPLIVFLHGLGENGDGIDDLRGTARRASSSGTSGPTSAPSSSCLPRTRAAAAPSPTTSGRSSPTRWRPTTSTRPACI